MTKSDLETVHLGVKRPRGVSLLHVLLIVGCGAEPVLEARAPVTSVPIEAAPDPFDLVFIDPPATLRVGQLVQLEVRATLGGVPVDPGPVTWHTSSPDRIEVHADGTVRALTEGLAFLDARSPRGDAMVELLVVQSNP